MQMEKGVLVLVLQGTDEINDDVQHAIVVGAGARLIIDPCEPEHLHLNWDALRGCVGNSTYERTLYIRRLHQHPQTKHSKKDPRRRKSNPTAARIEKQRAKREYARHLTLLRMIADKNDNPNKT